MTMTPERLARLLHASVVDENTQLYAAMLTKSVDGECSSPTSWDCLLRSIQGLPQEQRDTMLKFVRQVVVDTVSTMLGLLDGTCTLEVGFTDEFCLTIENENTPLNGYLQDYFIQLEQEKDQSPY